MKDYGKGPGDEKSIARPKDCFTQSHNQKPFSYIERHNRGEKSEASKIRRTAYKDRYS